MDWSFLNTLSMKSSRFMAALLFTLFQRTLFPIFNLATFLTSPSFLVDQCPFGTKQTQTFLPCLCFFFQLAKSRLCFPYTEKYSSDPSKRHQTIHVDFSRETLECFLSAKSFVFLVHLGYLELLVGWISLEAPRLLRFFNLHKFLTMSLVSKCWEHMCKFAVDWNSLSARRQKVLHFFLSFLSLGKLKKLRSARFLELFLYTESAQYLIFICLLLK